MLNLIAVLIFIAVTCALLGWMERGRRTRWFEVLKGTSGATQEATAGPSPSFLERWERESMKAGLNWTRTHWAMILGICSSISLILVFADQMALAWFIFLAGAIGPRVVVGRLARARSAQFAAQLPQALFLAASVLRAGGTLMQAIDSIAAEMPDPLGDEFKRIQQRMRLHIPAHEAMMETLERVDVPEFASVVVAARISSEVGGNLAHIFDQIARSVVEAQNARRMLQAFTTEGRMSANLIAGLPFAVLTLLHLLSPGYLEPLLMTWPGRIILGACIGTIGLGWYTIRRMTEIDLF